MRGPLRFLAMGVALWAFASTEAVAARSPPPAPPGTDPSRLEGAASGRFSYYDRQIWRTAFAEALRGRHKAAAKTAQAASDQALAPVLVWLRLRDGYEASPQTGYDRFLEAHPDFPSLGAIRQRREEDLLKGADAAKLRNLFRNSPPLTADGAAMWAMQLQADGRTTEAVALARKTWRNSDPTKRVERRLYKSFGKHFTADDHWRRLDRQLWDGRRTAAARMQKRVSPAQWRLARARLRLRGQRPGVDAVVKAVPKSLLNDPGLIYERIHFRRKAGLRRSAQDLLLASGVLGGRPEKVWIERRIQIRNLIAEREYDKAYRIARDHGLSKGASFAQAEFEAGWLALRFLDRPEQALTHFRTLFDGVSYPVSRARGAYWVGRTEAVLGDQEAARAWFAKAAQHPLTFYGQLASHELGEAHLKLPVASSLPPDPASLGAFRKSKLPTIIVRLAEINQYGLARRFLSQLLNQAPDTEIHHLAAGMARASGSPALMLAMGKLAARTGYIIPDVAYPVLQAATGQDRISPALAHAVIRQESAFNAAAISPAGAHGLMQLMPRTAKRVARAERVSHSRDRLLDDPAYNALLGSAYLAEQIRRFDGFLPMAIAAYNAGPGRVKSWTAKSGDPRTGAVDPIDWIEMIPYGETRNYVQRVMESFQAYRVRFSGRSSGDLRLANDIGLNDIFLCKSPAADIC